MDDLEYVIGLAAGSLLMAQVVAGQHRDPTLREKVSEMLPTRGGRSRPDADDGTRHRKMLAVCEKKQELLDRIATPENEPADGTHQDPQGILRERVRGWSPGERTTLLIDLAFADPFEPYSLKHSSQDIRLAMNIVAFVIGENTAAVDAIHDAKRSAGAAGRNKTMVRVGVIGTITALVLGGVGWLAAPLIGTAIGTAAGLSGAAATAHGLALLGGGSLATGGFGMAGGMWLVAGTGGAVGLVTGTGSTALYGLGAAQTRHELVKLQVSFRLVVLQDRADTRKAQEVIAKLVAEQDRLKAILDEERALNDDNARRVKDLEDKVGAVGAAIGWMRHEAGDDDS